MTLQELSDLLRQLLEKHESVALPGMGRFVVETVPSKLLNEGKIVTPPSKNLLFESSDLHPDSLLHTEYARKKHISEGEAMAEVAELLRVLKKNLIDNFLVEIPGFGMIKFGTGGSFGFEPDAAFNVNAENFGLEPLPIKPKLESEELVGEQPVAEDVLPEQKNDEPQQPEEMLEIAEMVSVEEVAEEVQEVKEMVSEEEVTEVDEAEGNKEMREQEVKRVDKKDESVVEEKNRVEADRKLSGYRKVFIIIGVVVAVLVIAIAVLVIFKEQFMPFWENLLYSEEELEILKRAGR